MITDNSIYGTGGKVLLVIVSIATLGWIYEKIRRRLIKVCGKCCSPICDPIGRAIDCICDPITNCIKTKICDPLGNAIKTRICLPLSRAIQN